MRAPRGVDHGLGVTERDERSRRVARINRKRDAAADAVRGGVLQEASVRGFLPRSLAWSQTSGSALSNE